MPRPRRPEAERRPEAWPVPAVSPGFVRPPAPRPAPPAATGPGTGLRTAQEWGSAVLAAVATLAVLAIPGAVLAVVVGDGSSASPLLLVPVAVALAVGGSVGAELGPFGLAGVAATPLLATLAAVALGTSLVVARSRPADAVPAQAVRALGVFVVGLAAVAVAGRASTEGGTLTVAVFPTLLGGILWFGGALALGIAWRRPDVLPPGARRVRDHLAGPAAGIGAVLGASWLGGLALVVAATLDGASDPRAALLPEVAGEGTPAVALVVAIVVFAPTALLGALAYCLGVPVVGPAGGGMGGVGPGGVGTGLADQLGSGPSWWLAPLVGAVICLLGGMAAALHAPTPDAAVRRGWALGPALALVLGLVTVVTAVSAGPFTARLDLAPAVILGLGWGVFGGLLGAVVAPGLPAALRGGRLGPTSSTVGQVVGALVVLAFLIGAFAIGLAAAAQVG